MVSNWVNEVDDDAKKFTGQTSIDAGRPRENTTCLLNCAKCRKRQTFWFMRSASQIIPMYSAPLNSFAFGDSLGSGKWTQSSEDAMLSSRDKLSCRSLSSRPRAVVRQEVLALGEVVEAETDRVRLHSAEARDTNEVSHSVADTVADCQLRKRFDAEEVDELEPAGVLELCRVGSVGRVVHRSDVDVTHDVQPCLLHVVDEVDEMTRCPRVCHHQ